MIDIKRRLERKAMFQDAVIYLNSGGIIYIDGAYVAMISDDPFRYDVGLVSYQKTFWKDVLGKTHMCFKAKASWTTCTEKVFFYFLYTADYFSSIKPFRFKGRIDKPTEEKLEGLLSWLYKGLEHYIIKGHDKDFLPWANWLNFSEYDDIDKAITDIKDKLNGAYFVYNDMQ